MSSNTLVTKPEQRPDSIDDILSTLKRYDASVIKDLEDYLQDQYEKGYSDVNANLALLKLYELSEETSTLREEATIKILIKGLTKFADEDFTLYLHLLPGYTLSTQSEYASKIQSIVSLYELLISSKYTDFVAKNQELGNVVNGKNLEIIEQTHNKTDTAKFIVNEAPSETVSAGRLYKVVGQLI
ncbi:unnamed protein product [Cyberlindnera jadinii]|uniref:ARM repeat-containing protein n=1 Tax=Cyberlindnera jadinii (strain ATCC 18201 / CBS 1600 / BCRC 20928 / JCM 3617 / NBRC 0987 / NRRL Y-1542) TaxID=983966 RepID=A0A0H5C8G0_CYBJN|nr:ARM repeat-containing protein [Cyberlindnera jadinii NRRL Y-1542]ODV70731.1 ARM repeat-containing protein [Cyberlindnera jadinii NRRL Y-1542]CEP24282.1 unnamed protein product [Cyberlindnera jadinii]